MSIFIRSSVLLLILTSVADVRPLHADSAVHPRLVMTNSDVHTIHEQLGNVPLFDESLKATKTAVDIELAKGIDTPIPQDYSGGYTHTQHKKNYAIAQQAGALYQILGEEKYAEYVRDMLLQYAEMYRLLPLHPKPRSYARGKIFWQCLNDANWLVYMSQAYDAIYTYLSAEEREILEVQLFRPFADHISIDSPQFFNRIHNHSTWGTAAVGMIGLVMDDDELIHRALYGLDVDNFSDARDNDGGFIRHHGQKAGFLANLDNAFSPDGYYTEGPYYQRYAMYPFLVFAQSLRNSMYQEQAFGRNGGVLLKAVETLIQLSDHNGKFFPLNDAQKGMSLEANELVTAIDIAYQASQDHSLLDIAKRQNRVLLDGAGFATALAISRGAAQPYDKKSLQLADGRDGTQGGLSILRSGEKKIELLYKYTAQGLSHGHYDKLSYSLYEHGSEVLQDYGMVRFVNIGQKGGGNYLPENATWAKQSIAHNTLVVNETSHFSGAYDIGSQYHSELIFFDVTNPNAQLASAVENNAYPGITIQRTVALLTLADLPNPIVLDILEVQSDAKNQYDLPFHYLGQVVNTNFSFAPAASRRVLGEAHGYQHLYLEAHGANNEIANTKFTWLNRGRFFTLTSLPTPTDEYIFARLGANDPEFNLRRDPAFIIRRKDTSDSVFVNVIEPHGTYSPVDELAVDAVSNIENLKIESQSSKHLGISITTKSGQRAVLKLARTGNNETNHTSVGEKEVSWNGPFHFTQELQE